MGVTVSLPVQSGHIEPLEHLTRLRARYLMTGGRPMGTHYSQYETQAEMNALCLILARQCGDLRSCDPSLP
jgi:hypothetical protein